MSYTLEGPSYALFKMMSLLKSNMSAKLTTLRSEMVTNTATLAFFSTITSAIAALMLQNPASASWLPYYVAIGACSIDLLPIVSMYPLEDDQDGNAHGGVGQSNHLIICSIFNYYDDLELVRIASEFYVRAVRELAREQMDLSITGISPGGWDTSKAVYFPVLLGEEEKEETHLIYESQLVFGVLHKETSAWI